MNEMAPGPRPAIGATSDIPNGAGGVPGVVGLQWGKVGSRSLRLLIPSLSALALISVIMLALGANPVSVISAIIVNGLGTPYYLSETLMVTAPLVLCGVAAAIPFSARLWNIGGTGQLLAGAVATVLVALTVGSALPGAVLAAVAMFAGIGAGVAWAMIAGLMKVRLGSNEIIVTLMLNLVAAFVADYVITGPWAEGTATETRLIPAGSRFGSFWQQGFNETILVAVAVALLAGGLLSYTRLGFGIRAAGRNLRASQLAGFSSGRLWLSAFGLGGAAAGLAGALLVVGVHSALLPGMNEQYGYDGIAIALVAGLRPALIVPAAFVFAVVQVGGIGLSSIGVSTSITYVIEAVLIISLLLFRVIRVRT